jgi:HD superfamily phosphodiesterase
MEYLRAQITKLLINHFETDNRRIEHAMRVLYHAENIAADYDNYDMDIVIATALLHDVGIKPSEEKLGYNNGKTQEEYGPAVAECLLASINFPPEKIEIVKNIIGNHHSKPRYDYPELTILKAADLIVNKNERV